MTLKVSAADAIHSGKFNRVPMMQGVNLDEGEMSRFLNNDYYGPPPRAEEARSRCRIILRRVFRKHTDSQWTKPLLNKNNALRKEGWIFTRKEVR